MHFCRTITGAYQCEWGFQDQQYRGSVSIQVEGTCDGDYGYVVAVLQITNKSRGLLKDTTGFASYTVTYTCMVLRPFRGEVMDVLVTTVSKART